MKTFILVWLVVIIQTPVYTQKSIKELDIVFEQGIKKWNIPGMSVGIIKDGQVILARGYGVSKEGTSTKPDSKTMYAIASNTKAFTSTAIATLVEKNKVTLDDKVRKFFPRFRLYDDYSSNNVTIRDLLCHRVGYANYSGDVIWYKSQRSASEILPRIRYVPKAFDFRNGYGYSNLMYITAGEIIRDISGKSWDQYIKDTFIEPLHMTRTITSISDLPNFDNIATPHKPIGQKNIPINWTNWDNMGSAGSIISTVDDMLVWLNLHLSHGTLQDKNYFSQEMQEIMWHPHNSFMVNHKARERFPRNFAAYGLGWSIYDHFGHKVITHSGAYDGMYSKVSMVPDLNLGIVILTNSMKSIGTYLTYEILDHYLLQKESTTNWLDIGLKNNESYAKNLELKKDAIRTKRKFGTQPSVNPKEIAGTYQDKMYGLEIDISFNDKNELLLHFNKAPELEARLKHWHYNTYEIKWLNEHAWFDFGTLAFITDNNNEVTEIRFDVPNYDIFFDEIKATRVK